MISSVCGENNFDTFITDWFDEKWSTVHLQWQPKLVRFDGTQEKNIDLEDSYAEAQLGCWVF